MNKYNLSLDSVFFTLLCDMIIKSFWEYKNFDFFSMYILFFEKNNLFTKDVFVKLCDFSIRQFFNHMMFVI